MPRFVTAARVAAEALEHIGATGLRDTGPDPDMLDRALRAFDSILQEFAGTNEAWWLRPAEVEIPLTADVAEYDLEDTLGSDYPANWIDAPVSAVLIDPNGLRRPIELMRRSKYLAYQDLTTAGAPDGVWIDRTVPHLVMRTYPVIAVSDYSIGLSFQTLSPDIVSDKTGAESHGMPAAWQRWGKLATAYDISGGSVMSLPERERARIEKDALLAKRALLGSNNREHAKRGHTQPRDF